MDILVGNSVIGQSNCGSGIFWIPAMQQEDFILDWNLSGTKIYRIMNIRIKSMSVLETLHILAWRWIMVFNRWLCMKYNSNNPFIIVWGKRRKDVIFNTCPPGILTENDFSWLMDMPCCTAAILPLLEIHLSHRMVFIPAHYMDSQIK